MKKLILVLAILFVATALFSYEGKPPYPYYNSDIFYQYEAATDGAIFSQPSGYGAYVYFKPLTWEDTYTLWKVEIWWNPHTERFEEESFEEVYLITSKDDGNTSAAVAHRDEYGPPRHTQRRNSRTLITQFYNGRREIIIRYELDRTISDLPFWTAEEVRN